MISEELKAYALHGGQHQVDGWLEESAMAMTIAISQHQAAMDRQGAVGEIGVHHGRYFIVLALLRQTGEMALALDIFSDQHLNVDKSGSGNLKIFSSNLQKHGVGINTVNIQQNDSLRLNSNDLLSMIKGGGFRLFSIDGGHQAINVVHDLKIVEPALIEGGVIMLDDFYNADWPGVNEGFFEYVSKNSKLVPFCYGGNKLFLCNSAEQKDWFDWINKCIVPISTHSKQVALKGYQVFHIVPPGMSQLENISIF